MGVLGVVVGVLKLTVVLVLIGGGVLGGMAAMDPSVANTVETTAAEYLDDSEAGPVEEPAAQPSPTLTPTSTPTPTPSPSVTPTPDATAAPGTPVLTPVPTSTPEPTPTPTLAPTPTPIGDGPTLDIGVDESWDDDTDPDDPGQSTYDTGDEVVTSRTVEYHVHVKINQRRANHDLPPMAPSRYIGSVSRAHSEDMADRGYFDHTNPDGEGPSERFEKFPDACGNGYGENIAANYVDTRVEGTDGGTDRHMTNEEIAQALVEQWMNSTGHRENILTERWEYVGTGIYITGADSGAKVYATQNFCATRD